MLFVLVGTVVLSLTSQEIMAMSPLERAKACRELPGIQNPEKRLLAPFSASLGLRVREYLEVHKASVPPPSGWFSEPKVYISITERRRTKRRHKTTMEVLLTAPVPRDQELARALGEALIRGCIIQRLADSPRAGTPETLLKAAFHPLTFVHRSLITHTLEQMGPIIVPELLPWSYRRYRRDRNRTGYLMAKYASYILRVSPAGTPRLALQSAPHDLRLKLIELYGKYRPGSAIKPLLKYANSDSQELRKAARQAILSYFEGPVLEKGAVGTIRLPGGVETTAVLYMSSRQQAYHAIRKEIEKATQGDYDRTLRGKKLAEELFRVWDSLKAKRWELEFAKAYREYKNSGDTDRATKQFMDILAHDPNVSNRELMAPVFTEMAKRRLKSGDLRSAIRYTRLALMVKPSTALESDLYYLVGLAHEKEKDIRAAVHWYRRALDTMPSHPQAFAALWNITPIPHVHERGYMDAAMLISGLLALALAALLFSRNR